MLSRGLRITFLVGIVFVLFALGLHTVLRYYNAPADVEYDLVNVFAATFASTILTFFIGVLLYDYQTERAEAGREEQLRSLLVAELDEISQALDHANAMKVLLSGGSEAEVVITHLQPTVIEEAARAGFFAPQCVAEALRLARNMRTYNTKVQYLLSALSSRAGGEPSSDGFVLHATEEIEETRRAIVEDALSLTKYA